MAVAVAHLLTLDSTRHQEAFKSLIENKATMVVPDAQDGKSGDVIAIAPDAPRPTSTRKGCPRNVRRTKVIVDVREFRSALPSLLHQVHTCCRLRTRTLVLTLLHLFS